MDLVRICRWLNDRGAEYIVIGGMAMLRLGFTRATEDIDLLVGNSPANEALVIDAIAQLEDHAAREIQPGEIARYEVIRVADELVIDLMGKACGITYEQAKDRVDWQEVGDVRIPFASSALMLELKRSVREKDVLDRQFLVALIGKPERG
jgi:hypothetical protein